MEHRQVSWRVGGRQGVSGNVSNALQDGARGKYPTAVAYLDQVLLLTRTVGCGFVTYIQPVSSSRHPTCGYCAIRGSRPAPMTGLGSSGRRSAIPST